MKDVQTLIADIHRNERMDENDVRKVRRAFGQDLTVTLTEADTLFELNAVSDKPENWGPYFTSVLAAYVDDREAPQDYVSGSSAAWLISKISHDGIVETETELKLLMNVLKTAHHVPDALQKFALDQVLSAVMSGRGVVSGSMLTPGILGEAEVKLLRQVLYAGSGKGGIGITRTEAEALFRLNDATSGRANHPSWQTLFVHAIANYLMVISAPAIPTPEEALHRENWLNDDAANFGNRFVGSFKSLFDQRREEQRTDGSGGYSNLKTGDVARAEQIDLREAKWLIDRLLTDGKHDENEMALLSFIKDECPDIDAALHTYDSAD
ncbi:hypothetical protein GCM10009069_12920 [Algimonas arctica]|uniref:Uncharacterized protein n=1 Tax=Algimonas arctica TaxID=1479486 RepID=A0A8J3CPQ8_9PROT|nr:hypothetical protein [Algimonas arctica]GHA91176.1 hypothetical protein GCM10009069_12920 [Algimonas arctica]